MKIALMQMAATPLDLERNLETIRDAAVRAEALGAELLLTPELFVSGYAPNELAGWLTPERVAGIRADVSRIAAEARIAIAASFPLARADGTFAIAAGLWDAEGEELLLYEKVHLWGDEVRAFTPGLSKPAVVEWNDRRVGLQVCFDVEFPESVRAVAEQGADLVLVPTAIDGESDYVSNVLVPARAAENELVVAYADHARTVSAERAEQDPTVDFTGLSTVAGLRGEVFGRAGHGPELLIADIPAPGSVEPDANYLTSRRLDLYRQWR